MLELQKIHDIFRSAPQINLKNTRIHWKKVAIFLLFELIFSAITAPVILFYGPFENIKSVVVGSLYTTYSHKYMAEFFLSQGAIERIISMDGYYNKSEVAQDEKPSEQPVHDINIKASHSDKVTLTYINGGRSFQGYLINIDDPTIVKVATSEKLPIEGERASTIAKRHKAITAINAGGFTYSESWSSTGGAYEGFIIQDGKVTGNVYPDEDTLDDAIGFTDKGQLIFGRYSVNDLKMKNVKEAICFFGPKLIVNGKKMFLPGETGGLGIAPRTAIGQKANGEVLFLNVDGRDLLGSLGATMYDLQEILYKQGVVNAINLDGGSSSAMYYEGKIINRQTNSVGERTIPSIFMVSPGEDGEKK